MVIVYSYVNLPEGIPFTNDSENDNILLLKPGPDNSGPQSLMLISP
jgi:hypothetical protein